LIRPPQQVRRILDTGCQAISTSNATLWRLNGIDRAAIGRCD